MELRECLRLRTRSPPGFSLRLTLEVYNFYWFYRGGECGYVVLEEEPPIVARVCNAGGAIEARVYSASCLGIDEGGVEGRLRYVLGLDEDLEEFWGIAQRDPLLRGFAELFRGWRLRASSPWWSLVVGICQQNTGFRQGWRMLGRILKLLGRPVWIGGDELRLPPAPQDVVEGQGLLRAAGVGYRWRSLLSVALAAMKGLLGVDRLRCLGAAGAEKELRKLRGVGAYTARLALALSLRSYSLAPIDRWLRALASYAYGVEPGEVEREWHSRWGRWSALAAIALTIALDAEPLGRALERVKRGELVPNERAVPTPLTLWRWKGF